MKHRITVREMVYAAAFTAVLAVCSWVSIPGPVPFTLQTFAIAAAITMLGARLGGLAVTTWILLGAVGVPVFSNFNGGAGALFGVTGGYILGFLLAAPLYGLVLRLPGKKIVWQAAGLLTGLIAMYAFGTAWYVVAYARGGGEIGVMAALAKCVIPFVLPDLAKLTLALIVGRILRPHLRLQAQTSRS